MGGECEESITFTNVICGAMKSGYKWLGWTETWHKCTKGDSLGLEVLDHSGSDQMQGKGVQLLWCTGDKPVLLLGSDMEIAREAAYLTCVQCKQWGLILLFPKDLETKMWSNHECEKKHPTWIQHWHGWRREMSMTDSLTLCIFLQTLYDRTDRYRLVAK